MALSILSAALPAWSIGLGGPVTGPVLLQPLRIEIPVLLGADEALPRADCVRIAPPHDGSDTQFFPKQVRLTLDNSPLPRLTITSSIAVREPFLEFRIFLGCNGEISRDYLLLTRQHEAGDELNASRTPTEATIASAPASVLLPSPRTQASSAPLVHMLPPQSRKSEAPTNAPMTYPAPTDKNQLRLRRDSTLNILARSRYPQNQATRDEYRRLMALANPALFGDATQVGSVPLPAGTVLTIPPNLPLPERVSASASTNPPLASVPATADTVVSAKRPPVGSETRTASRDRLVIGGANDNSGGRLLSAKEAAATIERLDQMLTAQASSEQEITEKLKSLEALFASTKSQLQFLEAKSKQQEADQRQLQAKLDARPEPKSLGFLELLVLVLGGGAVGAALLAFSHRQQMQRNRYSGAVTSDRNLSTLEPHPIFAAAAPSPDVDFDDDVVPLSKSVAPPPGVSPMTRQPPVSQASPATRVSHLRAAPKKPTAPNKLATGGEAQKASSALDQLTRTTSASGASKARADSAGDKELETSPGVASIGVPAPAQATGIETPTKRPAEDQGIAFAPSLAALSVPTIAHEEPPQIAAALPEISFSLDLGALSLPRRPARISSNIDFAEPNARSENHHTDDQLESDSPIAFDLTPRTDAEIEVALAIERDLAAKPQALVAKAESSKSAEDPAVELAGIMISMGMEKDAERTLIDYILEDPKRDLGPWLKALEMYRESGRRDEFEKLAVSLRQNLNVAADPWDMPLLATSPSIEGFSRINETIKKLWPTKEADAYLGSLLGDNRDGSRAGFPQAVAEEILWLLRILRVRRELI